MYLSSQLLFAFNPILCPIRMLKIALFLPDMLNFI